MKVFISIIFIALGSYFIFDAGITIYSVNQTTESLEYTSDGQYQEIVTSNETNPDLKLTYIFLTAGAALIISGGFLLYFARRKN